jgi:hypothetical protein
MELGFPSPAMFTQEISSFFGLQDARKLLTLRREDQRPSIAHSQDSAWRVIFESFHCVAMAMG